MIRHNMALILVWINLAVSIVMTVKILEKIQEDKPQYQLKKWEMDLVKKMVSFVEEKKSELDYKILLTLVLGHAINRWSANGLTRFRWR